MCDISELLIFDVTSEESGVEQQLLSKLLVAICKSVSHYISTLFDEETEDYTENPTSLNMLKGQ